MHISMAALLNRSLRSSSRQNANPHDLRATDHPSKHDIGEHIHDSSTSKLDSNPYKRRRLSSSKYAHAPVVAQRRLKSDIFPATPAKALDNDVIPEIDSAIPTNDIPSKNPTTSMISNQSTTQYNGVLRNNGEGESQTNPDKRSLRSHKGGSRSKSELSLYFSNYDELISIEPKDPGTAFLRDRGSISLTKRFIDSLGPETRLYITDEVVRPETPKQRSLMLVDRSLCRPKSADAFQPFSNNTGFQSEDLPGTSVPKVDKPQYLDFSAIERHLQHYNDDPLNDSVYFKAHRRAQRQEKQLRNIERERAQHEKNQLERLLDGLKGHEWLKVMGVSGLTDSEKKAYEPKKELFIQEVTDLIEKFRFWKEEEKRRKFEREQNTLAEDDASECQSGGDVTSDGATSEHNDVDTCAARQLHQETKTAIGVDSNAQRTHVLQSTSTILTSEKPFTSFYTKSYLRDAAIGRHRRGGRTSFAFGQPVPNVPEKPFELPPDMLSQDVLAANARRRRRIRREGKVSLES